MSRQAARSSMDNIGEPVAIIGTGCRFPGDSTTPSKFWRLLREPCDLLKPLGVGFDSKSWYQKSAKHHGHFNVKHSYQLDDENAYRRFDAPFFGISAVEANTMDPQMRMLLETVYEALETAGQSIESLRGSDTAVYAGMMIDGYKAVMERDMLSMGTYHASGLSRAMMSNRLSYFFDWHGPSMTIDTACSSSMIAVHQAVMQLRTGQSRVAIAAGANLLLDPSDYIALSNLEMLSPDGRSKMWDKSANGYARGEGIAAVVLKLLSAAEADGDHIECVIRETATNQDGRTKGITMPSATAQTELILDCYARAGLDILDPTQRPQYFEAHGTGTPAGDPIEAEAIKTAFFRDTGATTHRRDKLFVGSVKTVIGHSESVAGLAALIKTSLALQNSTIPPNLLLQELNPNVQPFYTNLEIPSAAIPWPRVPDGCPRRASVNSFGFGGSNSHAILESYAPIKKRLASYQNCFIPFVFSAASPASLLSNLAATCEYLKASKAETSLCNLALTLYSRRSRHSYGIAVVASSIRELCQKLETTCQAFAEAQANSIGIKPSTQLSSGQYRKPRILGVFTGQGAQCPHMGAALIEKSVFCQQIIDRLEARLARLPEKDRPSWSLRQELLKAPAARISKAAVSQPLCTALQILQVELLRRADVEFSAVVGHSSGEITAAYCAGMVTADEAICIAYYRGLISERTSSSRRERGAMIAVGTTFLDAQELCEEEEFKNRVCVAAINSPTSITLSGDSDVVEHMHKILEDEGKLVRSLHVDQAYHSFHMEKCSEEYVRALQALNIEAKGAEAPWFSSVDSGRRVGIEDLSRIRSSYWNENMIQPVTFMQAINQAWKSQGPFDVAVELGPHPVLKRPTLETIRELHGQNIPYTGAHLRERDAIESFSHALGFLWTNVAFANLSSYDRCVTGHVDSELITGLPPYTWDHQKEYWHESRYAKSIRTRPGSVHELLGHLTPDSNDKDMRWRNVLCPNEIPWLKNHSLENQAIFPAAGYVVAAVEATASMAKRRGLTVSLIEVRDLELGKALAFDSDNAKMETVVTLNNIKQLNNVIDASFNFHAAPMLSDGPLNLLASGSIAANLGDSDRNVLPSRGCRETGLSNIDHEDFYNSLSSLGYEYAEQFRALRGLQRKFGFASGSIAVETSAMLVHPAVLDAAFQSLFLANCAPNSGGIWSLHVPKTIRTVRVNPFLCPASTASNKPVSFDCIQPKDTPSFECDIDIFARVSDFEQGMIQIQGLCCVPLIRPTAQDDKEMFATTVWDVAAPDGERVAFDGEPNVEDVRRASLLERMSVFFLRRLSTGVPEQHSSRRTDPYQHYFNFASHTLSQAQDGKLPFWSSEWANDSYEDLRAAYEPFLEFPDVQLLKAFGDNIVDIATGKMQGIEIGMRNHMLSQIYEFGLGFQEHTIFLARIVKQIVHRHSGMKILEVGAGTGVATKKVFSEVGERFSSYTFTDISSGFFERAQDLFSSHSSRMLYKVLDISRDVSSQGFEEHSYDLMIASGVLHATPNLKDTLSNVRRLLKPGGFLVVFELQPISAVMGTIFGALPGWWLGVQDGRTLSPCVDLTTWDALLRASGFSGCETSVQKYNDAVMPMIVFASQAVDSRVNFLRAPRSTPMQLFQDDPSMAEEELLILGGRDARTSGLIESLRSLLRSQWGDRIRTVSSLAALDLTTVNSNITLLSLLDLETSIFDDLKSDTWDAMKTCLQQANSIFWISSNRRSENPHANMMIGLLRSVKHEIPTLAIQSFDFESQDLPNAQTIADALLAFKGAVMWQRRDQDDGLLWTIEPEIVSDKDGTLLIPRIMPNQEMNDRYNSSRRPVFSTGSYNTSSDNLGLLDLEEPQLCWQKAAVPQRRPGSTIRVTHSLRSALRIHKVGFMHLALGHSLDSNNQVVALAIQHTLEVTPFVRLALPVPVPAGQETALVSLLAYQLLANFLVSETPYGATVVIHEAGESFAAVLRDETQRNGVNLFLTTTSTATLRSGWHHIHPTAPDRKIRDLVPKDSAVFCDLSVDQSASAAGARLKTHLPSHCCVYDYSSVFADSSTCEPLQAQSSYLQKLLEDCVSRCLAAPQSDHSSPSVPLNVFSMAHGGYPWDIVEWPILAPCVTARVCPADSQVRFSENKTYWLCGLSGSLGLLLCEWMTHRGARHVVISSRSPKVEEQWLAKMRSLGADVRIFACDITDRTAVQDLHRQIESGLPPIAGVCQGAMVLEDVAISNMSLDSLLKVTQPKVLGSIHMDELFQAHEDDLEFFIFFSSGGSIVGNAGQGNYAAGNLFMTALAERRRQRGLAASVMHIGPIYGVGYLNNRGLDLDFHVTSKRKSMFPISEQDFCQHFAEAIIAGRPRSQSSYSEITSGLARVEWPHESGPLLSHIVLEQVHKASDSPRRLKASLKSQLLETRGLEQLERVVREALLFKLSVLFQMELSTLSRAQSNTMRLDEMGIDSLMALDIRDWFVKELQVNIPVLKILGGMTISDLIETAVETIPRSFVPNLADEQSNENLSPERMASGIDMEEETKAATTQSSHSATHSTASAESGRVNSTTKSVGSRTPVSSVESPSPTSTEPARFLEDVLQHPIELLFEEKTEISTEDEKQPFSLQVVSFTDAVTESLGESPHDLYNVSIESSSQPKEARQVIQPFAVIDEKVLELSFSQSLFYFSSAFADNPTHLNLTSTFQMKGELRVEDMKAAILALGKEHESLRTRFFVENSLPMQGVMKSSLLHLEHYIIQHESELAAYINDIHNYVYNLERGDILRLAVVSMSADQNFVIMGTHHLAMDGQSAVPFMNSLLEYYTGAPTNRRTRPKQYSEISEKQHADFRLGRLEEELTYWKTELADPPPPLPIMRMSSFTSRPLLQGYGNRQVDVRVGLETKKTIQVLCRRCRVTPFHFYLAVYRVLLCKYTGAKDLAIGIGDANRTEEYMMESIGAFVNVLPLVFRTDLQLRFDAILQETRSKAHAALKHSRLSFHLLLSELGIARSATTTPIFQAFMDYRLVGETMNWGEFQFKLLSFQRSIMAYDVAVDIFDNAGGDCHLTFIVRDDLYSQADVEQLAESYVCLVEALAREPHATGCEAQIFEESKIQNALDLGRGPVYQSRQWGHTVVHRIDEIVKRYPMKTAVVDGDGIAVSYYDIFHDGIIKIAAELEATGVTSGSHVAVLQEPTPNWVSSVLAIWRIGGTYLPLDLGTSWTRLAIMVKDSQPQVVLVDEHTQGHVRRLELNGGKVINVSKSKRSGKKIPISALPDAASAILYTSGSSGTPKGIVLTHRGIQSWLQPCGLVYNMKPGSEVVLQQSSQGFDMSLMQILTALCFGGSVCLLPRKFRGDAKVISEIIARHNITHTYGTPSEYLSWLRYGDSQGLRRSPWRTALVGGELLATSVLKEFAALNKVDLRFHHMYGTTESTFCATVMELNYKETSAEDANQTAGQVNYPAGVALPNYNVYILDEYQQPLPPGFKGEIFIGGGGVAQGYLHNPSLTAETFIPDPFATVEDHARGWKMMQRTGDLGRWSRTEHGLIIIEGRVHGDTMVKLRGLRVDLRDIETAMLRAGAGLLTDVVVSVRRTSPDLPEFLVAHVVFKSDPSQEKDNHSSRVQNIRMNLQLPLSMKPAFIMELDSLPMTASGKLDRRAIDALPLLDEHINHDKVIWTASEKRLKNVWENVLHITHTLSINPETDFFHIGGTSLLVLGLRDKIKAEFDVELSLVDLFETSTLSTMAGRIDGRAHAPEVIDWERETRLLPSISNADSSTLQPIPKSSARVVVVTGGTGYLGKALLQALENDSTIKDIHCLAVRNATSRADLKPFTKVTAHEGDLGQVQLGLSQALIDDLFGRVDLVIHNGADTSYLKTYQSMRQSNYQTTRDLIEWCMPRMVPFHYISTAGVGCYAPGSPLREVSMRSTPPPLVGDSTGYTACKWASEVFLENLVRRHPDWPIYVHRPTLISRDDIPQLDAVHNILGFARKLGAVASAQGLARGVMNVVTLKTVVAGIMKCVLSYNHGDAGCVHFVNHAGTLELPLNDMRKWALERTASGDVRFADVEFAEIPLEEWVRRAIEHGMHPTMAVLLTTFARHGEVEFPVVVAGEAAG
ncbi:hypothetical protein F5Y19DRAFT_481509 [Xylariaceae sp. FL1651]|nr:hypothetical protein F5Y19DRAFT_481509 [Xylariaceae sp. FL1651]